MSTPKAEMFYWVTIMFSQTLGTALGDWTADTAGLGYAGRRGDLRRPAGAGRWLLYFWTRISRTLLFWAAFVLTRPLGAVVGDFLDKPVATAAWSSAAITASAVLLVFIAACILVFPQRAAQESH